MTIQGIDSNIPFSSLPTRELKPVYVPLVMPSVTEDGMKPSYFIGRGDKGYDSSTPPLVPVVGANSSFPYGLRAQGGETIVLPDLSEFEGVRRLPEGKELGERISALLELVDPYGAATAGPDGKPYSLLEHSWEVADITKPLGRNLNWRIEEIQQAENSALLHDIGKVAIPDDIVLKSGQFTPQERSSMDMHSGLGGYITLGLGLPSLAMEVSNSHENRDGTGPNGIFAGNLPKSVGIVRVGDTIASLDGVGVTDPSLGTSALGTRTARRFYNSQLPTGAWRSVLIEKKGTHYDPEMVDIALKTGTGKFYKPLPPTSNYRPLTQYVAIAAD